MLSTPARRGCGTRKAGGVYIDTGRSAGGAPVEFFYMDPPVRVDEALAGDLGVKAIGVSLFQQGDTWHVIDWVGAQYYPNVADFCEEVKHLGLSRRCELAADEYAKLSRGSTIILIHPKAWLNEFEELRAELAAEDAPARCPKEKHDLSLPIEEMCAGLWWHDLVGTAERVVADEPVMRQMPSFSYFGTETSADQSRTYTPAIFARFPIGQLVVVKDREGDRSEKALKRTAGTALPVYEVEE